MTVGGHRDEIAAAHAASGERAARLRHIADRRIAALDRLAQHADHAVGGRHETEHSAHQRRLARAVRPEHADEFALIHHEAGIAQNRALAEFERHLLEFEHGCGGGGARRCAAASQSH